MAHYLRGSGADYEVDLEKMVRDVPSARARYEDEVEQAKELVESAATPSGVKGWRW
jgi:hypothetical protein